MVSPASRGLFSRALMESNVAGFRYKTPEQHFVLTNAFLKYSGCSMKSLNQDLQKVLPCVQALSSDKIRNVTKQVQEDTMTNIKEVWDEWTHLLDIVLPWTPTVDTPDLPMQVITAFQQGQVANMPLLVGTNKDEAIAFVGDLGSGLKYLRGVDYRFVLDAFFGEEVAGRVVKRYPGPGFFESAWDQIATVVTDYWFKCSTQNLALHNAQAGFPTYNYRYNLLITVKEAAAYYPAIPAVCANRTCHSTELPAVLGSLHYAKEPTPTEKMVMEELQDYWGSFIHGGTPKHQGSEWPAFNASRVGLLIGDKVEHESERALCEFWDALGYPRSTFQSQSGDHQGQVQAVSSVYV